MNNPSQSEFPRNQAGAYTLEQPPNWWLRLTSNWDHPQRTLEQRAQGRRSKLASWIILGLMVVDIVLLPIGIGAPGTLTAILVASGGLVLAALLNRHGFVAAAGFIIILLTCGGVMGSLLSEPTGLTLDSLPGYDLLTIAVLVAASVLPRTSTFVVAAVNIGLITADFALQPHARDLQRDLQFYGDPLTGGLALLARPIALQIILATVAYLWVRGMELEITRADRAEEVAALEHAFAEQRQQLEEGVREMVDVLAQAANGKGHVRIQQIQQEQLWIIASSINTLLSRLQRANQAEHMLQRTEQEIHRLVAAIEMAQSGRQALWPAASGTAVDRILELIRGNQSSLSPQTVPVSRPAASPQELSGSGPLSREQQQRDARER